MFEFDFIFWGLLCVALFYTFMIGFFFANFLEEPQEMDLWDWVKITFLSIMWFPFTIWAMCRSGKIIDDWAQEEHEHYEHQND